MSEDFVDFEKQIRADMVEKILSDKPGDPLSLGYVRLMNPQPGDHPVTTWREAVTVMLNALL